MNELTELLERFRRGGEFLASLTTGAAGPELDFTPDPTQLGIRATVCHLMDREMLYHSHFSALIAEANPTLQEMDTLAWATHLNYSRRKFSTAVEMFRRVRTENYDLLQGLPPESWSPRLTEHFRAHLEYTESRILAIREIRQAYKAARQSGVNA
jgi:hypothetical protein